MKYSPSIDAAVGSAKRALKEIVGMGDALEAHDALDEVGAELVRRMEEVAAEAAVLRAISQRTRTRK